MGKRVITGVDLKLKDVDVSDIAVSVEVSQSLGNIATAHVVLQDKDIDIVLSTNHGMVSDEIVVRGVDVSDWVYGYAVVVDVRATYPRTVELFMYADREVLSINGGYPWERS